MRKTFWPLCPIYTRALASSDYLALTELNSNWASNKRVYMKKSCPAWRVTLSSRNGNSARWVNILIEPPFCSRVNDSPSLGKMYENWLLSRRVTLLLRGTSFLLHIKGAYVILLMNYHIRFRSHRYKRNSTPGKFFLYTSHQTAKLACNRPCLNVWLL